MQIRSHRPDRIIHDAGALRWRGGVVWTLDGATSTIKLHLEASLIGTRTVATSLIPAGARSVGCPVAVRVADPDYTITEIRGSHAGGDATSDNAGAVARGEFRPGRIPREITNEPLYWWTA